MSVVETEDIVWADEAFVNVKWARVSESASEIASRLGTMTDELDRRFGPMHWTGITDTWGDRAESRTEFVAANPSRNGVGEPDAAMYGYTLTLNGSTNEADLHIIVSAGAVTLGRRNPAHRASVRIVRNGHRSLSRAIGDGVVRASVEAWTPLMVTLSDLATKDLDGRGGWLVTAGYRVWLADTVGPITTVPDGLSIEPVDAGTLVSVPDDWEPKAVVDAVARFRELNDLDALPH